MKKLIRRIAALALPLSCAAVIACARPRVASAHDYDLLIKGGRVIDPAAGRDGVLDVAVAGGRIAAVAPSIDPSRAKTVVDAGGLVVTPGLVDIHTHVFFGTVDGAYLANSYTAVWPDAFAPRSCTTTVVDAGSSGHRSFDVFERQTIAHSKTRVLAFLNIVGGGMRGGQLEQDLGDMDARATADAILAHPGEIVGVKVAHYRGPEWDPVRRAVEAARIAGVRVMVDFGEHVPELSLEELLLHVLRPGDIFTHAYARVPGRTSIVDEAGRVRPYVLEARRRGIIFDVGHGGGSFSLDQAVPALRQGFLPDSISTDMHAESLNGAMQDMTSVLSKLGALGVSLPDLIRRATASPAAIIGRPDLGRIAVGGAADLAILSASSGRYGYADTDGRRVEGAARLECEVTVRAGEVLWDRNGRTKPRWAPRPR
jgi:dihydroorotase